MPWRPSLSLVRIKITTLNIQGNNPLLSVAGNNGGYISQYNSQHWQPHPILRAPAQDTHDQSSATPASRRVETQMRVRRKLDEARNLPGSVYDIDHVAQVATDILSLVEGLSPSTLGYPLMNLAMDAYAMAYIALISCLYVLDENGRRRTKKKTVQRLCRLLNSVHTLIAEEASRKGICAQITKMLSKERRSKEILRMQEELLDILRDIEGDENAAILNSLTIALDCPYQ